MKYILLLIIVLFLHENVSAQTCLAPSLDFGNNEWIVRVFQLTNLSDYTASNQYVASNNYKGYYKQKIDGTSDLGARTRLQWAAENTSRPTQATAFTVNTTNNYGTAYQGCTMSTQYFLFTHKRKGFPPGNYEIYVDIWDDLTAVYLNGAMIDQLASYGSSYFSKYCVYLDQNSELEIRTDNSGGSMSELAFRIIPTTMTFNFSDDANICIGEALKLTASARTATNVDLNNLFTNSSWTYAPTPPTGRITSGANTREATINTNQAGTFVFNYRAKFQECVVNKNFNVVISSPLGDTSLFGNNTWNVYGFSNKTTTPNTDQNYLRNNLKYYGYYTQTISTANNFGFSTTELATGGWNRNNRPSSSSTWQGCNLPSNDNFTYIHKRQGFPCATYTLTLTNRGLNTKVYINGTLVIVNTAKCSNATACTVNLGTFDLDANSKIEVRTNENTGDVLSVLNIIPTLSTNLANHNDTKTCAVKGNQWVDFYQVNGRYLGSVRGTTPESNLGNVTITTFVETSNPMVPACSNADNLTAVMQRHWLINASINGAGEVRLPYSNTEFLNLANASSLSTNPFDQVSHPDQSTIKLSRYSGPLNVNSNPFDNCISGGTVLHQQSANLFRTNPFHYQDFIVPGFSEFWLHGSSTLTPLPTELANYSIECENYGTVIAWSANMNPSIKKMNLERSIDGNDWENISTHINTQTDYYSKEFKHIDVTTRNHYYRVLTTDINEVDKIHKILVSTCGNSTTGASLMAYPNPANNQFTIQINSEETGGRAEIAITDLSGKIVYNLPINSLKEYHSIVVDANNIAKGTYIIQLKGIKTNIQPVKIVIQ